GRNDRLSTLVGELVQRQVAVIVVLESTNGALAAKAATKSIPIVFMQGADPVQIGLVDSLNRPGGNLTGTGLLSAETAAKRLELFLQLLPKTTSIGYLRNPSNPVYAEAETREVQVAARAHGVRLVIANASRPSEIETAFADLVQQRADALQVSSGAGSSRYSAVPKWEEAGMLTNQTCKVRRLPMLKSVAIIILAIALGVAAWLLPMRGEQATAQSGPLHILVVEYDIVPAEIDKYLTAIKELGAAAVKEP